MKHHAPHIVFSGGGTMGHLFPGLAVAAELKRLAPHVQITFAGTGKAAEQRHVLLAEYEYLSLACRPRRQGMLESLRFVTDNLLGVRQASQFLRSRPADAVVGLGGYASYPMSRAAVAASTPLILLEQNAWPGKATRRLAPYAALICVAYEAAKRSLPAGGPVRVTGNPVRQSVNGSDMPRKNGPRRLLVLGGSQGSQSLNAAVPLALARLATEFDGWSVLHQTGEANVIETERRYAEFGIAAHVRPFVENLPLVMAHSDLAISRAGGTTLAELAAAGLPAVLVPYPDASDDHQRRNALEYLTAGACRMIEGRNGAASIASQLTAELPDLLQSHECRQMMAQPMRRMSRPAAAWHVARMVLEQARSTRALRCAA